MRHFNSSEHSRCRNAEKNKETVRTNPEFPATLLPLTRVYLKSRYANISAVGALYIIGSFFLGMSSVSSVIGHDLMSTTLLASFDRSNLITFAFESTKTDLLTSTIIRTVGSVVWRFCGCGGRIVTGTAPEKKNQS